MPKIIFNPFGNYFWKKFSNNWKLQTKQDIIIYMFFSTKGYNLDRPHCCFNAMNCSCGNGLLKV